MGIEPYDRTLTRVRCSHLSYSPLEGLFFLQRSFQIPENRTTKVPQVHFRVLRSHPSSDLFDRSVMICHGLLRKEVIQPHLPIRLPCYDLTPIIEPAFDSCLLAVSSLASGVFNFHGLTGGVYKARERIHRGMLIRDY